MQIRVVWEEPGERLAEIAGIRIERPCVRRMAVDMDQGSVSP